jgi:hypothetical protein
MAAMKYILTTFAALSLGSASFSISQFLNWNQWVERAVALLVALFLAALLCAPLWG